MTARRFVMVVAVLAASALFSSNVSAQTFNGAGINPGDNTPAGGTSVINVAGVPSYTTLTVSVTWPGAAAPHTWGGDVILRLTAPNAVVTDLLVRMGSSTVAGVGDSSDFLGTYTFDDSATNRIIDVANTLGGAAVVTPGSYRATTNLFNGNGSPTFTGEVAQTLNNLNGNVGDGPWTLFYSDNASQDYAPIGEWSMTFTSTAVPEPSTWAMIGISAMGAGTIGYRQMKLKRRRKLRKKTAPAAK